MTGILHLSQCTACSRRCALYDVHLDCIHVAVQNLSELAARGDTGAWCIGRLARNVYRLALSHTLVLLAVSKRLMDEETYYHIRRTYEVYDAVI